MKHESKGHAMITGANGQLGKAITRQLVARGYAVHALPGSKLDITLPDAVEKAFAGKAINWLINCAAYTQVDGAEDDFSRAMEVNAIAVGHLAMLCRDRDIPMIHFSTDYVYDNGLERPLREDDPTEPKSVYAISKLAGEDIIRETWKKHLVFRTSWLYSHEGHNFLNTMLRLAKEKEQLSIVDDQTGAPTYVEDLADAVGVIMEKVRQAADPEKRWGTYNISNAGQTTWFDYAKTIFSLASLDTRCLPVSTEAFNAPAKRPSYSVLSNEKLHRIFGIEMQEWKAALKKCLQKQGNFRE